MSYEVIKIDSEQIAREGAVMGKEVFQVGNSASNQDFYTYDDVDLKGKPYTITNAQNDDMFQLEWNGTGIVLKGRKMFPR